MLDFKQEYDSKEELWFSFYVAELKEAGWIKSAEYHPETFTVTEEYKSHYFVGEKQRDVKLLNGHQYTPDWKIVWADKAEGIFFWLKGGSYNKSAFPFSKPRKDDFIPFVAHCTADSEKLSYLDVKGAMVGRNNSSAITFPINQKIMARDGVFIQKIVVSLCDKGIFSRTFFPRYVVTAEKYKKDYKRNGKLIAREGDSKIKVDIRLLQHWIKIKTKCQVTQTTR